MLDTKRMLRYRFKVGRAVHTAQQIAVGDMGDTASAIRDLAHALAALASAVEELLEEQVPVELNRAG